MQLSKADLKQIEAVASADNVRRKARNISLDDVQFERFQKYCQEQRLAPNKVLDTLIGLFLDAAE
ncbi:MAG: hypothetical protein NTX25_02255 [Proteobacteria bacterium]|nr:hypothetical protein [Pseudomonadota bacterium]